jgi:hypothetical protein
MINKMKMFGFLSVLLVTASSSKAVTETVIDLTGNVTPVNNSINGALVFAANPKPTGTGFIDPFLREQANGNDNAERGVNTSINSPPFQDKPGPWTHDLTVGDLAVIDYNSASYYEFFLDANQDHNGPLSLTSFKLFVTGGSPFVTVADLTTALGGVSAFDLENGAPGSVRVDVHSGTGSGSGDMFILIPTGLLPASGNLYLDAGFSADLGLFSLPSGAGSGYAPNDGFEEWWAITKTHEVPDGGSTMLLLGSALTAFGLIRRKLR